MNVMVNFVIMNGIVDIIVYGIYVKFVKIFLSFFIIIRNCYVSYIMIGEYIILNIICIFFFGKRSCIVLEK